MYTVPVGTVPTKESIKAAIDFNELHRGRYDKLEKYYDGENATITTRTKEAGLKNTKVIVNHAAYITDINVGYLLGSPVDYSPPEEADISLVTDEFRKQTIADTDTEIGEIVSKFGKAYELEYALEDNSVRSKAVDPRSCIIVYDNTLEHKKLFAITYAGVNEDKYINVTVYTEDEIQNWNEKLELSEKSDHFFFAVPVIEYRNNSRQKGDYERVLSLIDAYDLLQSDRINDKQQLVEAILVLYGINMTSEQKKELRESRVMSAPPKLDGSQAEYLIKELNEEQVEVLKKSIEMDIHKISMTPNLSDENFVGNASGVAIKYKLIAFEQSIVKKERYFERGLRERLQLYMNYLEVARNMSSIPVYEIDVVFKRNLPQNDLETSQMAMNSEGLVSRETLVAQYSFVDNAKAEIQKAQEEALQRAQSLADTFATDQPSTRTQEKE